VSQRCRNIRFARLTNPHSVTVARLFPNRFRRGGRRHLIARRQDCETTSPSTPRQSSPSRNKWSLSIMLPDWPLRTPCGRQCGARCDDLRSGLGAPRLTRPTVFHYLGMSASGGCKGRTISFSTVLILAGVSLDRIQRRCSNCLLLFLSFLYAVVTPATEARKTLARIWLFLSEPPTVQSPLYSLRSCRFHSSF
jgi:hypothetical protein